MYWPMETSLCGVNKRGGGLGKPQYAMVRLHVPSTDVKLAQQCSLGQWIWKNDSFKKLRIYTGSSFLIAITFFEYCSIGFYPYVGLACILRLTSITRKTRCYEWMYFQSDKRYFLFQEKYLIYKFFLIIILSFLKFLFQMKTVLFFLSFTF